MGCYNDNKVVKKFSVVLVPLLLIVLVSYGAYLWSRLKKDVKTEAPNPDFIQPGDPDVPAGNAFLSVSKTSPDYPQTYTVLSQVFVKDSKHYLGGERGDVPLMDLELGLITKDLEKSFTVTLVGKVDYYASSEKTGEEEGIFDVNSINLVRGERVSLTLAHIQEGVENGRREFEDFCTQTDMFFCSYLGFGFGGEFVNTLEVSPTTLENGRVFSPAEVAVTGIVRSLDYPNYYEDNQQLR